MIAGLKARDIMPDLLVTVQGEATLEEAAGMMLQMDIGSLLVVDGMGNLIGAGNGSIHHPQSLLRVPQHPERLRHTGLAPYQRILSIEHGIGAMPLCVIKGDPLFQMLASRPKLAKPVQCITQSMVRHEQVSCGLMLVR